MSEISKKLWKHNTTSCHACFRPSMKKFQLFHLNNSLARDQCQNDMSINYVFVSHGTMSHIWRFSSHNSSSRKTGRTKRPENRWINELQMSPLSVCRREMPTMERRRNIVVRQIITDEIRLTLDSVWIKLDIWKTFAVGKIQIKCGKSLVGGSNSEQTHIDWVKWKKKMF